MAEREPIPVSAEQARPDLKRALRMSEAIEAGQHFITVELNGVAFRAIAIDDAHLLARALLAVAPKD